MSSKKPISTVKIWFEGLPQPIPAQAESITGSQLLTVKLPYLRRNTQVFISDADGDSSKGFMTEVSLVSGPEPRLQILVQTGAPVFEPISDIPLMAPHADDGLEPVEVAESEEPGTPISLDDRLSTIPLLTPLCQDEDAQELEGRPALARADAPAMEASAPVPHAPLHHDNHRKSVDWRAHQQEVITRLPAPPMELEKPPSRLWFWLASLALIALVGGALYFHVDLEERTIGVAEAATKPSANVSSQRSTVQPRPGVERLTAVVKQPAVEQPAAVKQPAEPKAFAEARPPVDRSAPRVWLGGKHPTLVIPIEGSTKDANNYALGNPDGVVVNLPHARVSVPKRQYRFKDGGFRLLNVWAKNGGVHLRLFFYGPLPSYKLHIDPDAVRFTLQP